MKAYRFVYDKVTVNGIEYTHTIPRLETYQNSFISNLTEFKNGLIRIGKTFSKINYKENK